jgi:hypothetical protein
MASSIIQTGIGSLLGDSARIAQLISSPEGIVELVNEETNSLEGDIPGPRDLFPTRAIGKIDRLILAGNPRIQNAFRDPLEQGRMTEKGVGEANTHLASAMNDLNDKVRHYLSLNKLAIDGKLSDIPRALKFTSDSFSFIKQIRTYITELFLIRQALQANIGALRAVEARMVGMLVGNITALVNLENEICNWALPSVPSIMAMLSGPWRWNGFNFNSLTNFNFDALLSVPNLNFTYGACVIRALQLGQFFESQPSSISSAGVLLSATPVVAPLSGSYADSSRLNDPSYIGLMQATSTAVFDPSVNQSTNETSLPDPASIVSAYKLPASTYVANIVSTVSTLAPVVIQPGDVDYINGASTERQLRLRALLVQNVTLEKIVDSGYDPTLVAAWLLYLDANRVGRSGQWLSNLQQVFDANVAPSLTYLRSTEVPWNQVLGGTGLVGAPQAIPLISLLKADTTKQLHWKLSYVEAALLGYVRSTRFDVGADLTLFHAPTGTDFDYRSTSIDTGDTVSLILGQDDASFPVEMLLPQSMVATMTAVIELAAADIQTHATFQSTRPQFRYTYNTFAEAKLVDRFSQFWREFNANFQTFLSGDAYVLGFAVTYPEIINAAINPLADTTPYIALQADAAARNRGWQPGASLLPIPKVDIKQAIYTGPNDQNNGWSKGTFDTEEFLARPDIQAQPLPVQMALLRTLQGVATLTAAKSSLQDTVARSIADTQSVIDSALIAGWDTSSSATQAIPSGAETTVRFDTIAFDQSGYVQAGKKTFVAQTSGTMLLYTKVEWAGDSTYSRSVEIKQNGAVVSVTSDDSDIQEVSTQVTVKAGDVFTVVVVSTDPNPQTLSSGCAFMGIMTPSVE